MDDSALKLKNVLDEELTVYRELLSLSKRKQKLLLEKFSTDFIRIVKEEEALIQKLADLETARMQAVERMTGTQESSLDNLTDAIPDTALKADVWMVSTRLKEVVLEIKEINTHNQKLLEQALDLTKYSLSLLTTPPREVTYRAPGKNQPSPPTISKLIDRKA